MKKADPVMPIIPGLIANLWKAAPKAHYRFYPLCSQEIYSIHKLNERVNGELDYKRQAVLWALIHWL